MRSNIAWRSSTGRARQGVVTLKSLDFKTPGPGPAASSTTRTGSSGTDFLKNGRDLVKGGGAFEGSRRAAPFSGARPQSRLDTMTARFGGGNRFAAPQRIPMRLALNRIHVVNRLIVTMSRERLVQLKDVESRVRAVTEGKEQPVDQEGPRRGPRGGH